MAKRRFRSIRRFRSRRRFRRRGSRRLVKFVKRVIRRNTEIKYAAFNSGPTTIDAFNGSITRMAPLFTQGVSKSGRIGDRIKYKFIQFRMHFTLNDGVSLANPPMLMTRVILLQPRLTSFASQNLVYTADDWFDLPTNNQTLMTSPIRNTACRVLMDRVYMNSVNIAQQPNAALPSFTYIKKKVRVNNHVNFHGENQDLPNDPKDNYFLVIITNANALTDANLTHRFHFRISYIDL